MEKSSIEEKARKYDEALERAKEKYAMFEGMKQGDVLEDVFPELKESEGEQIRKALLRFHKSTIDIDGIKGEDILAWLENQDEQKPIEEYNITGISSKHADGKLGKMIENMESANNVEPKDYSSIDPHYFKSADKIEKQPSQWNISDYRTWQYIVSDVLTKHDGIGQYLDDGECKKIAKYMQENWSKKLSLELNSAWSEEDKRSLQGIIDEIQANKNNAPDYDLATYDRFLSWLKSLKDRVLPKQEWSKTDKEYRDAAIYYLRSYCNPYKVELIIEWLEALEPQNTWKPSDEQMVAVQEAMNIVGILTITGSKINSLYQDLKKLREE